MRTRLTPDCTKLVMSTARGFYIVIHNLNLSTLNSDLANVDFVEYHRIAMQEEEDGVRSEQGHWSREAPFTRTRNRAELVLDCPEDSKASCISSLVLHPHGWCMISRYTTREDDAEVRNLEIWGRNSFSIFLLAEILKLALFTFVLPIYPHLSSILHLFLVVSKPSVSHLHSEPVF